MDGKGASEIGAEVALVPRYKRFSDFEEGSKPSIDDEEIQLLREFDENGLIIVNGLVGEELIERIHADCNGHYQYEQKYSNQERRIHDAHFFSPAVKELACNTAILDLLKKLYGRTPFPFQTLNFEIGTEQPIHSDFIHFASQPRDFMAGVWVALEDVDEYNGPLVYYPKSHSLPALTLEALGVPIGPASDPYAVYHLYEKKIKEFIASLNLQRQFCTLKKGDVAIWASNLLHGGSEIKDPSRTRASQVTHYFFDNGFYYTPLQADPLSGKLGERVPYNILESRRRVGSTQDIPHSSVLTPILRFSSLLSRVISRMINKK